jgi:hypothetical protein
MARKVEAPPGGEQGTERQYVPKAFGNREDPYPIVVHMTNPTEGELRELSAMRGAVREDGSKIVSSHLAVARHVTKLTGGDYEVRGKLIKTGADLALFGEHEFVAEVALEILKQLSLKEQEKKLSGERSGSSSSATSPSDGTAATAEKPASTSSEVAP